MTTTESATDHIGARAAAIADDEMAQLLARTPRSRELYERAKATLPLGVASSFQAGDPDPIYVERGQGPRVWDVDGTERHETDVDRL